MITAAAATMPALAVALWFLREGKTAERKCADDGECDDFEFHMLCIITDPVPQRL